jgi:hypothetical protein
MKNVLLEEIEKYKRLSNYNPKMTLTENIKVISEAPFGVGAATTAKEVTSVLGKDIRAVMAEFKLGMTEARLVELLGKDAKSFEKEWVGALQKDLNGGYPKGSLGPLAKELSKVELLRRITADTKSAGRALTKAEMNAIIADAKSVGKLKAANFVGKETKTAAEGVKSTAEDVKVAEGLVTKYPTLKNLNWKRLLGWGAKAGIAVGALYAIYKMTHTDEPPIVTDTTTSGSTTTTTTTTGSKYKVCPDTFPIKQFCKNETIRKVQGCLKVTTDARFGPITQGALEAKGVSGTEITQATIDKVCNQQAATANTGYEDYSTDEIETSTGETSATTPKDGSNNDVVEQ